MEDFLDWKNVSNIVAIHNGWHLPAHKPDIRIEHMRANFSRAKFGDKIKGGRLGGEYILLLQYKGGQRYVLVSYIDDVFILEDRSGIGVIRLSRGR